MRHRGRGPLGVLKERAELTIQGLQVDRAPQLPIRQSSRQETSRRLGFNCNKFPRFSK